MGKILPFRTKEDATKEELLQYCKEAIEQDDFIILISHNDKDNITGIATNLAFRRDRIGMKGIMQDAQEIMFRIAPPKVFEGDEIGEGESE